MKKRAFLILMVLCQSCFTAYGIVCDTVLKKQLDSILADDQRYRAAMVLQPGRERDSIAALLRIRPNEVGNYYSNLQNRLDSINMAKTEPLFNTIGYPGKSKVGEPANTAAYYVVQHSGKIKKYFPLIKRAGRKGELSYRLVAMMQDRLLTIEGKEQIYGTQYSGVLEQDSATGEHKINWFLWPVKDFAHVNQRRKKAGFKETIKEEASGQGIELKLMTKAEVEAKYPWLIP